MFDLRGQVALITGATGHLGAAISEGFAEAGAAIAVCSTGQDRADDAAAQLTATYSVEAVGYEVDLRNPSAPARVVDEVKERFGRLDCLVNNASFSRANTFEAMTLKEWESGLEGTVTISMRMMQACLALLEASRGNVVNISSMYGIVSPDPAVYVGNRMGNPPNYGVGKAALLQLTRFAAVHLADRGIRVNAVSPGPFPSPEVQEDAAFIERLQQKVPLGRIGNPAEVKGAVIFLASPAASYVTGHNLVVDGGWTAW